MKCINCDCEFETSRKSRKFCGKSCSNSYNNKIRYIKIEVINKRCRTCDEYKSILEFNVRKGSVDGYRNECKNCLKNQTNNNPNRKENKKRYYQNHKEEIKDKVKNYRSENKESVKNYSKKYQMENKSKRKIRLKHRYDNDMLYKLSINIRSMVLKAFKRNGYTKNSKSYKVLGCTLEELKTHIELQFQDGMNWRNHGEWHIDHKEPISWAKTEEDVIRLSHYTNLQPLWAEENMKKKNYYKN